MSKAAVRYCLNSLAYLKARLVFNNSINPGSRFALSSDVRYSDLHGNNAVGKRSVVHQSTVGEFSYIGDDCRIVNANIGMFSSLGCGIKTALGRHPYHYLSQHPATYSVAGNTPSLVTQRLYDSEHALTSDGRFVSIGHDVWIGDDVKIFDGVSIGHGAVVGANSLVTKSIPPYAIVKGMPSVIVKYRFSPQDIDTLLRINWWAWDRELLRSALSEKLFCGSANLLEEFFISRVKCDNKIDS